MPKKVPVTPAQEEWLKQAVRNRTDIKTISAHLNCCDDTARRILVRLGLASYPGAKFQTARSREVHKWTRPCSGCRSTKPRPKWQFFCTPCQTARGMTSAEPDDAGIPLNRGHTKPHHTDIRG